LVAGGGGGSSAAVSGLFVCLFSGRTGRAEAVSGYGGG